MMLDGAAVVVAAVVSEPRFTERRAHAATLSAPRIETLPDGDPGDEARSFGERRRVSLRSTHPTPLLCRGRSVMSVPTQSGNLAKWGQTNF